MKKFLLIAMTCALVSGLSPAIFAQEEAPTIFVEDRNNYGNGADLFIRTDAESVQVLVTKADTDVESISIDDAPVFELDEFYSTLPANTVDSDGEVITEGIAYTVHLVSDGEIMATSDEITLANELRVFTVLEALEAGTGGIEVDPDGYIYHSDFGDGGRVPGNIVWKVTPTGEADILFQSEDLLATATGNWFDDEGNFYQSSLATNRLLQYTPDGELNVIADNLSNPVGVMQDSHGNFFVTNCGNASIQKITPDGVSERFILSILLSCPNGVAIDDDDNLYIANFNNREIVKITPEGDAESFTLTVGSNNGHITYHDGLLYIVVRGEHQLWVSDLEGNAKPFAGSGERSNADGVGLEAGLSLPNDIAFSPDGSILYFNEVAEETRGTFSPTYIRGITMLRDE